MADPLNVLIIMSDQHHADYLGVAGHPFIRTPHLDRLAAEGTRFTNAYCPSPLCGPCRMSFLTSLYPHETGIYNNGQCLPSDLPTFAHAFGAAGYDTALIGRMHITGPDQTHGFEQKLGQDVTASTLGGGHFPTTEGLHAGSGPVGFTRSGPGDSSYHHYDEQVTDLTAHWLGERAGAGRPFMVTVGLALPHPPFVCSPQDYALYEDAAELPATWRGDAISEHPYLRQILAKQRGQGEGAPTEADFRRSLIAYAGSVTATDRRVGRMLQALDEAGLTESTLVIYCSDHGEAAGEHGLWHKSTLLEASARVSLIMRLPGRVPAGATRPQAVNLIDLGPTALDYADAPALPCVSGRSLRALAQQPEAWLDETFSEYGGSFAPGLCRMVRRGPWKFIYYQGHPPQLFHLDRDPAESTDLAQDPALRTLVEQFTQRALSGWDPAALEQANQRWKQRNALIFDWFTSRPRPDAELYQGPAGCNRLDHDPSFIPQRQTDVGSY